MGPPTSPQATSSSVATTPESSLEAAVAAWVQLLVRTLKTCRMYDRENPTVGKFRARLASELSRILDAEGPITLRFTSEDVLFGETSTYPARSREDNLAQPFYRDGIRSITFLPGIGPGEVESFLDLVLRASGLLSEDEDLVTMLWDADLVHLDVDYVATDCDVDGGGGRRVPEVLVPWPKASREQAGEPARPRDTGASGDGPRWRSDDWETGEKWIDPEEAYARLGLTAPGELERFHAEFKAEESATAVRCALAVIGESLAAQPRREDCVEFGQFLARVLSEAIRLANWESALEALSLLRSCDVPGSSVAAVLSDLLGSNPAVPPECIAAIERQASDDLESFLNFARELGPEATPWLMAILAQSRHTLVRALLHGIVAELCRPQPERIRPWLSSPDPEVARDAVRILGKIGGNEVLELLRDVAFHAEPQLRHEVVAALSQVDRVAARPILISMLDQADGRLIGVILRHLSRERDQLVSRRLLLYLQEPGFRNRPYDERRAIYTAIGSCGGDEVLRTLQAQVFEGGWIPGQSDPHRRALARCLARIGSPAALAILRSGARSWRPGVRKVCAEALAGSHVDD